MYVYVYVYASVLRIRNSEAGSDLASWTLLTRSHLL